jgi:sugar lactone lactonase YvrE
MHRLHSVVRPCVFLIVLVLGVQILSIANAFTNGQAASKVLGQSEFTSVSSNTTANGMQNPFSVAIDPLSGAVFVADAGNNRVLRFTSSSALKSGSAAEGVLGQSNFTNDFPSATLDKMDSPFAITVDSAGRLWVADSRNHRVLRFDNAATKANGAAADGLLGQTGTATATASTMATPSGIAIDSTGTLWVTDLENHRILRFDNAATKANSAPADGVLGQSNFTNNLPATNASGFSFPQGVAVDNAGRLWVADVDSNRVLRFDNAAGKANGASADGVLGQTNFSGGASATTNSGLNSPNDIEVDSAGRLWVTDASNNRVLRFDNAASKANGAAADGVLGQPDFTSNTPTSNVNTMFRPAGLAIDSAGRLWVADNIPSRVLRFDNAATKPNGGNADGVLGQNAFTGNIAATAVDRMTLPTGVVIDSTGTLWVADTANHRVLRFDNAASKANGAPADGVLGQANFTSATPATTANGMRTPSGLAVDSAGRLWVTDSENNRVLRFDNAASKANGASADGVLGQPDFTSNTIALTANGMNEPSSLAVDSAGRLWVSDRVHNRVLRFDNAASKANGAAADGVLGQANFTSQLSTSTASGLSSPTGLAVDSDGRLWVVDLSNHRVLRFDNAASKSDGANANGVLGQPDFTSNLPSNGADKMNFPRAVSTDTTGNLWVVDLSNHRVLRFDNAASKSDGANADGVLGQPNFTSTGSGTSDTQMLGPFGVTLDNVGRLWVADSSNNRVLRFGGDQTQAITFNALTNKRLNDAAFNVSAVASSNLTVTLRSDTPSVCTVSGTTVTLVATGTCTIIASQIGNVTFEPAAPVTRSFSILPTIYQVYLPQTGY